MASVKVYNIEGKEVGSIELNDSVFGVEINEHLVHMAVVSHLANKRQGTQSAKTRSDARQGSIRAPQWKGGGVVFAPKPRDYSFKMNRKEKSAAVKSALTSRVSENKIYVMDEISLDEIKTKKVQAMLDALKIGKALIVLDKKDDKVILSARNIPTVRTALFNTINVYDILKYDTLVITKDAVAQIEEVYA